jgi:hypothetical protein
MKADTCRVEDCGNLAVGRCEISGQPYCRGHIQLHGQPTQKAHPAKLFPLRMLPKHETCPTCEGPVRLRFEGQLLACRDASQCGWSEVVEEVTA